MESGVASTEGHSRLVWAIASKITDAGKSLSPLETLDGSSWELGQSSASHGRYPGKHWTPRALDMRVLTPGAMRTHSVLTRRAGRRPGSSLES